MTRSVILVGGPDSGKTNYLAMLWRALDSGTRELRAAQQPKNIEFVLEILDHLFAGHFAPRTELNDARRDFIVEVQHQNGDEITELVVPDFSGELWSSAVKDCEIDSDWMEELKRSDGALLFVRVGSDLDVRPLDWVTSQRLLAKVGGVQDKSIPTQVVLCELLRFLEESLSTRKDGARPRLSVVVSAWDRVSTETREKGPTSYLEREYPLFAGRLKDATLLDVKTFGLSIVGGDLTADAEYRDKVLQDGIDGLGWVTCYNEGVWHADPDLTLPVSWVVGK